MPDVYVTCESCGGKRYNHETLAIRYRGKTIADVLAMTVEEALDFFKAIPPLKATLDNPDGSRARLHSPRATSHNPVRRRVTTSQTRP